MDGIWRNMENGVGMTSDELYEYLCSLKTGVVFIEGPSSCGKTTLLRKIERESAKKVFRTGYMYIVEYVLKECGAQIQKTREEFGHSFDNDILCFEDIDFLGGREVTQIRLAELLDKLSQSRLIIMSGIQLEARIAALLDAFPDSVRIRFEQAG